MTRPIATRIAVAIACVGATLSACSNAPNTSGADTAPRLNVSVATVSMIDVADTFEAGGVVEARTTATIMARITAPVSEVRVVSGDRVRAGQVMIVLDARDLDARARGASASATAAVQAAAAAVADQGAADAALTLAQASHRRISTLFERRSATAQEMDDATAAFRAAEARASAAAARVHAARAGVDSARAAHDAASTMAAFGLITAPFDGSVTDTMVEAGNMAMPGMPLVRVEDTRGFRLDLRLDESRVSQVKAGDRVPVTLDMEATTTVTATVAEISRAVDSDARASLVKLALPESIRLRSGTFGRATFRGRMRRALTVPSSALMRRGQLTSAFVVEHGVARLRLINASGTEVLAGLADGDIVVVSAPPTLADGRRVETGDR